MLLLASFSYLVRLSSRPSYSAPPCQCNFMPCHATSCQYVSCRFVKFVSAHAPHQNKTRTNNDTQEKAKRRKDERQNAEGVPSAGEKRVTCHAVLSPRLLPPKLAESDMIPLSEGNPEIAASLSHGRSRFEGCSFLLYLSSQIPVCSFPRGPPLDVELARFKSLLHLEQSIERTVCRSTDILGRKRETALVLYCTVPTCRYTTPRPCLRSSAEMSFRKGQEPYWTRHTARLYWIDHDDDDNHNRSMRATREQPTSGGERAGQLAEETNGTISIREELADSHDRWG